MAMMQSAPVTAQSSPTSARKLLSDFGAVTFYAAVIALMFVGWQIKDYRYLSAESGVGYFLGIAGGSLMLAMLLYPARKRLRHTRWLGGVRSLFRVHMALGIIGPVAILFHSNFSLGSMNSTVALFCMLLVAGSGLVGRYLYSRVHQGLYGRRIALQEVMATAASKRVEGRNIPNLPALSSLLKQLEKPPQIDKSGVLLLMLYERKIVRSGRRLRKLCSRLARRIKTRDVAASHSLRALIADIDDYVDACRHVVRFRIYERLFGLWHVFHLPLYLMLIVTGIVHVFAVHIY